MKKKGALNINSKTGVGVKKIKYYITTNYQTQEKKAFNLHFLLKCNTIFILANYFQKLYVFHSYEYINLKP